MRELSPTAASGTSGAISSVKRIRRDLRLYDHHVRDIAHQLPKGEVVVDDG